MSIKTDRTVPAGRLRSAFLSDIHLGTRECRANELLEFLQEYEMDTLYLVGDVVDLWSMKRRVHWPAAHHNVLRLILEKARRGTRVIYIPGNHDELLRPLCGSLLAGVEVYAECMHQTARGLRLLVVHGDDFDSAVRFSPAMKLVGSALYSLILLAACVVSRLRRMAGLPHWSLASWLKSRVGTAREYVERFERAAALAARARGLDGVVCGHIHRPQMQHIEGVLYCNDGDWVEHCTALVEDQRGQLSLWRREPANLVRLPLAVGIAKAA